MQAKYSGYLKRQSEEIERRTRHERSGLAGGHRLRRGERLVERGAPMFAGGSAADAGTGGAHSGAHARGGIAAPGASEEARSRRLKMRVASRAPVPEWHFRLSIFNISAPRSPPARRIECFVDRMFSHGLQLQRPWASAWRTRRTAAGDPVAGHKKFYTCYGCHGVDRLQQRLSRLQRSRAASSERGVHHLRAARIQVRPAAASDHACAGFLALRSRHRGHRRLSAGSRAGEADRRHRPASRPSRPLPASPVTATTGWASRRR